MFVDYFDDVVGEWLLVGIGVGVGFGLFDG